MTNMQRIFLHENEKTVFDGNSDDMNYEAVYLPENHFIKEESIFMKDLFETLLFPFQTLDIAKKAGITMEYNRWPLNARFSLDYAGYAGSGKYEFPAGVRRTV